MKAVQDGTVRAGRQAYAGSPLELIGAYAMKTLAVVVLLLFGPAAGSGESPGRSLMARAHIQAVASTKALAVARYHQRRLTTVLDDSGASRGASRDASVDGSDSLDLSVSTIFEPDRYEYTIETPETFRGRAVSVVSFRPLRVGSRMLASVHHDLRNQVMNTVINHLEGRAFLDRSSGAIVHFDAHLTRPPLGFALGQVFQADVACDQIQVGTSWFPSRIIATFHYQMRDWHVLFLARSVVHQQVVATFVYQS
jgi:hypothetical protein